VGTKKQKSNTFLVVPGQISVADGGKGKKVEKSVGGVKTQGQVGRDVRSAEKLQKN